MNPQVTIIVAPRERFSYTRESLESIYQHTSIPFSLVYVDGGSPANVRRYLEAKAKEKQFQLIRTDHYLSPTHARNMGLSHVTTPYLVFIDNDVVVTPGWLDRLVQCAEETEAAVVAPLTCIGKPEDQIIHLAGGEARILVDQEGDQVKRWVHEKHYFVNRPMATVKDQLYRRECEFAEFHCMLVRTSIFEKTGPLDEGFLSTREHIDFCLTVSQAGGKIYCEPESIVTYVPGALTLTDIPFFMLRWSDAWELSSLEHFHQKWQLGTDDQYFHKRYKRLGHRRHKAVVKPWVQRLTFKRGNPRVERVLLRLDKAINRYLTDRYTRRLQADVEQSTTAPTRQLVSP